MWGSSLGDNYPGDVCNAAHCPNQQAAESGWLKVTPRNQRACLLILSLCWCAEKNFRRKTQRSLPILLYFSRNSLTLRRHSLGKTNLNLMKWLRLIKYTMIRKWKIEVRIKKDSHVPKTTLSGFFLFYSEICPKTKFTVGMWNKFREKEKKPWSSKFKGEVQKGCCWLPLKESLMVQRVPLKSLEKGGRGRRTGRKKRVR